MNRKLSGIMVVLALVMLMAACDSEALMSVADKSNYKNENINKSDMAVQEVVNSKQLFTAEYATINNVENKEIVNKSINIIDSNDKDNAEELVKKFIKFISNEYKSVDSLNTLDVYLSADISDIERKMFDWWGQNIHRISDTWYCDTMMYHYNEFYINTISRIKRDIDGVDTDIDIAVKWYVVKEDGNLKIKSASVVSLTEVKECINSILQADNGDDSLKDVTIYKPTKSQGMEYNNIQSYDANAANKLIEIYKNSSVTVITDTNEGSGFVIQPGYIVTAYSNIYRANAIKIIFNDKTDKYISEIVYANKEQNIAVLKMNEPVGVAVNIRNSDDSIVGNAIGVVGCAGDHLEHVTCGNVYASGVNELGYKSLLVRIPLTLDGIGSAVVNTSGDVIGIVTDNNKDFKESTKVMSLDGIRDVIDGIQSKKWNDSKYLKLVDMRWNKKDSVSDSQCIDDKGKSVEYDITSSMESSDILSNINSMAIIN